MKTHRLLLGGAILAALTACSGGGIDLNVSTVDNSISQGGGGGGGGTVNPCASYQVPGGSDVRRGNYDGRNCTYSAQFVGLTNPLRTNVTIPALPAGGVHVFQDSLVVGQDVNTGAAPTNGPVLTIEAGNTLAFSDSADYVLVTRGARIEANGTASQPIVFTSFADAVSNTAGANDVSQWGGLVINGNAITSNCTEQQRTTNACHVRSEGQPSFYGGNNRADNSGTLRYVIVKHTGFEVAPGDELNGITFNAVGSGTTVENVQVYSTFDDGFEFFGGSVNLTNVIAMYVRDDALDFTDGYDGTITNALVIQWQSEGNHCIEHDGVGSGRYVNDPRILPLTRVTVNNMTCIMSSQPLGTHGASTGAIVRLGGELVLNRSVFYTPYGDSRNVGAPTNDCWVFGNQTGTTNPARDGATRVTDTVFACGERIASATPNVGSQAIPDWLGNVAPTTVNTRNALLTGTAATDARVLEANSFYSLPANQMRVATGGALIFPTSAPAQVGAVTQFSDWTTPWAFGLRAANADRPLWFAQ